MSLAEKLAYYRQTIQANLEIGKFTAGDMVLASREMDVDEADHRRYRSLWVSGQIAGRLGKEDAADLYKWICKDAKTYNDQEPAIKVLVTEWMAQVFEDSLVAQTN